MVDDFLDAFFGSGRADRGASACAQPFGDLDAYLDAGLGIALLKRLRVGVRNHELHAFKLLVDHVVDGVAARAAHPEHRDAGLQLFAFAHLQVQCHLLFPPVFTFGLVDRAQSPLPRNLAFTLLKVTKKTPSRHKIWGATDTA